MHAIVTTETSNRLVCENRVRRNVCVHWRSRKKKIKQAVFSLFDAVLLLKREKRDVNAKKYVPCTERMP